MKRRALLAVLFALASSAACTLATSFDGLDDGARTVVDAGGERATAPDGRSVSDAPTDATPPVESDAAWDGCDGGKPCPRVLASGRTSPLGIDVAGDWVYWVEPSSASIWKTHRLYGGVTRVDAPSDFVTDPFDVAVDPSGTLYWSERSLVRVGTRPLSGGPRKNLAQAPAKALAYIAVAGNLVFATDYITSAPNAGYVYALSASSSSLFESQPSPTAGVAAKLGVVVWSQSLNGALLKSDVTDPSTVVYAGYADGTVQGIAFDGTLIYTVEAGHLLVKVDVTTGKRSVVTDLGGSIGKGDLALDDTYLYLSAPTLGQILRIPR